MKILQLAGMAALGWLAGEALSAVTIEVWREHEVKLANECAEVHYTTIAGVYMRCYPVRDTGHK